MQLDLTAPAGRRAKPARTAGGRGQAVYWPTKVGRSDLCASGGTPQIGVAIVFRLPYNLLGDLKGAA
jgi:hypothetical protein